MTTRAMISNFEDLTTALLDEFIVGPSGEPITVAEVRDWVALAAERQRDAVDVPITVDLDALLESSYEMKLYESGIDAMSELDLLDILASSGAATVDGGLSSTVEYQARIIEITDADA